jgi:3-methyladenine DNA glycosylase AlkD
LSAPEIAGGFLFDSDHTILTGLAGSPMLWERRIALVATHYFIRRNRLEPNWRIADLLLNDKEDLMHKAVGWMLREAGKIDRAALVQYLAPRYKTMPRTMLRYAIEHFDAGQRALYLQGKI